MNDVPGQGDPVDGGEITLGLEAETGNWLPGQGSFNQPGSTSPTRSTTR